MVLDQQKADMATTTTVINDFSIVVATENGTGSQTSNSVLVLSLFKMGIPVNGKNLFPSNIKGLPTWYNIRASKDGYIARTQSIEVCVAMNQITAAEDIAKIPAGGVCILPKDWNWTLSREDIHYYEVPLKPLMDEANIAKELRERVANMVYVGVVAYLFNIPMDIVWQALLANFNGKEKPAKINMDMAQRAYDWSVANLVKKDGYHFEPMPGGNANKIVITGNEAAGLGTLFGGVQVVGWYPITPSTSLVDTIFENRDLRRDPDHVHPETGKPLETVAIMQAEDEIAAIGTIIGAGWAGARAMTATSGPGISLMAEFTGLAYFAEIPCVIWDVTRIGPSTGLPTRTSQGDLMSLYTLSHGDTSHIVLIPGNVNEAFEFGWRSLNISEQYQTPVFVMSDLDLGMNNWVSDPFTYPDEAVNHGKTLRLDTLTEFIAEKGEWYRYKDYDGDGVGYRTIPGTNHPRAAYFTRGTGHNPQAIYSERSEDWMNNLGRIKAKVHGSRTHLPQPAVDINPAAKIGILSYGTNDPAIVEGRDTLKAQGIETSYMRIKALPLADSVAEFINSHERIYVIENNFDGQMAQIIRMESADNLSHLTSLHLGDGLPMTAAWVVDQITAREGK